MEANEESGHVNKGYEIFKNVKSEEDFNKLQKEQFPDPSRGSSIGLFVSTLKFKIIFAIAAKGMGKRPSHPHGVGATGFAVVLDNPDIPHSSYFVPGKRFRVRMRHSNFNLDDDAGLDGRGAAFKFIDDEEGGTFDLSLNTGGINFFQSLTSFGEFVSAFRNPDQQIYKEWLFKYPINIYSTIEVMRRAPESYCMMTYYGHVTYDFLATDGQKRYSRFRVKPHGYTQESGYPDEQSQQEIWNTARYPDVNLSKTYLRDEYLDRLRNGVAKYDLQIQFHTADDNSDTSIFNTSVEWDTKNHPWISIVEITMTTPLSSDAMEFTKTNLRYHPSCMSIPDARTQNDYNSLSHARVRVYPASQSARLKAILKPNYSDPLIKYIVVIKISHMHHAGTNGDVFISFVGSLSATRPILLDETLKDDFKRDSLGTYEVTNVDVGELLAIKLELKSSSCDFLNLDYVLVFNTAKKNHTEFPFYTWLKDEAYIQRGNASILRKEKNSYLLQHRQIELQDRQARYIWQPRENLPSGLASDKNGELPVEELLKQPKDIGRNNPTISHANGSADAVGASDTHLNILCETCKNDEEFGFNFLNGSNPFSLRRCSSLPKSFPESLIDDVLGDGTSLTNELKAGKLYIAEYPQLGTLLQEADDDNYVAAPVGLFYVNKNDSLTPIAIRLNPEEGDENPIWLPSDSAEDWLNAKLWLKCADAQQQILGVHLFRTHFVVEAFTIACYRQLPACHPVFKLINSYARHTSARNYDGWEEAEKKYSGCRSYLSKVCCHFDVQDLFVKQCLTKYGLEDKDKLPNYLFRDDAILLWEAIENYVTEMLQLFYSDDETLAADTEVQNWIYDVKENGFCCSLIKNEIPSKFSKLSEVISWVTMLIFTSSCLHSCTRTTKHDSAASMLASVPFMRRAPPTGKGEVTMNDILKAFPKSNQACALVNTVSGVVVHRKKRVTLANHLVKVFTDEDARKVIARFRQQLHLISEVIKDRNSKSHWQYHHLLPERVQSAME